MTTTITLSNGEKISSLLMLIAEALNDPIASRLTSKHFSDFRKKRLSGEISFVEDKWNRGIASIATCNLDLAYLRSVFNKLIELGEWHFPNLKNTGHPYPCFENSTRCK
ncbi:phage integrase [Photobacterium phosphoreum]|uniref:phage integrase n=1 Tax=Photobacterium phosphoreum TaxID=659 RepID=UPI0011B1EC0F|nr:hypothetical protein [Photobacterium phosphoreum]